MTDIASAPAPDLSIVSPVYGCVGCLEELVERIKAAVGRMDMRYEILLVDDASPDGAWQRIREITALHPQVRGIRLSRNFGQHAAISAGLSEANGAIVVVMDCDLQDQPEEIPALVSALGGGVSVVLASREDRQDGAFKRLGSRVFYKTINDRALRGARTFSRIRIYLRDAGCTTHLPLTTMMALKFRNLLR